MEPRFFRSSAAFRKWLEKNHTLKTEILVGFYKKDSGKANMTWAQSVDEALCFGWIDGVRKRIDGLSYTIRFTPRKPKSIWSAINIKRVGELTELELMYPAGLKAFNARDEKRSVIYSYENAPKELDAASLNQLRANKKAPGHSSKSKHLGINARQPIGYSARKEKRLVQNGLGYSLKTQQMS